jgi:dihydrofolate synthase/folylpolyglutamate synthase
MDFDEALRYMQGRLRLGIKLGNERFLALLDRLGNPREALRIVHVAGTKGKGSTTAMAASILRAAGCRTGVYLSPYVYDVRERVQIDGEPIPREDFARWVTKIQPHCDAVEAAGLGPTTEFELKTAVGFCWFAEQAVDFAVIEVGIGGRLDATNVFTRPLVTVITNIGLDHMELLGDTLAKIATEKAGIVKPGVPCVTGAPVGGEADEVIARICAERGAPLIHVAETGADATYGSNADGTLSITTARRSLAGLRPRMAGAFQHANAAVAAAAIDAIPEDALPALPDAVVRAGLEQAYLPGRFEQIAERPAVIIDAAHNELAAEALAGALSDRFLDRPANGVRPRLVLVVGMTRHHAPLSFLRPLAALRPAALIATEPSFRALPALEVAAAAKQWDLPDVRIAAGGAAEAVCAALRMAGPDDVVCLTGSFYTIGDVPPGLWPRLIEESLCEKPL